MSSVTIGPPTQAGFEQFVINVMQIPTSILPSNSLSIAYAYAVAIDLALLAIQQVSQIQYTLAVYNLAGDNLINYAADNPSLEPPNNTFFATLRQQFNVSKFQGGVISNAGDEATSAGIEVVEALKLLTLNDLQNLKTPYGRYYLGVAQQFGTVWGLTR